MILLTNIEYPPANRRDLINATINLADYLAGLDKADYTS